jgi:hypothetical protein
MVWAYSDAVPRRYFRDTGAVLRVKRAGGGGSFRLSAFVHLAFIGGGKFSLRLCRWGNKQICG